MQVFDLNLSENNYWRELFEKYRTEVMLKSEIRSENYTEKSFNIDKQLSTFLMYDETRESIAGVCAVFIPTHWPKTIARLYNRSFVDPFYRIKGLSKSNNVSNLGKGKNIGKLCHQFSYNHMIATCKKHGVQLGVATRENTGTSNSINVMYRCAIDKDENWKIDNRYFLTAPYPEEAVCWQRLIYIPLSEHSAESNLNQIPNITKVEYEKRFYAR